MALTLLIVDSEGKDADGAPLALSFDSPRIVIGRATSCDVLLVDPTVSQRHASIRHEGGRKLIIDEGSENGIVVGSVKLPPHTPRAVRDGELVRIGRVWIELSFDVQPPSPVEQVQAVAMGLLRRQLKAAGEQIHPTVEVLSGPDADRELILDDPEREYIVGRSKEADLCLSDPLCSRRHISLLAVGSAWQVRDLNSKRGSKLLSGEVEPTALTEQPVVWQPDDKVRLGDSELALSTPLAEAFEEALRTPDVRMSPSEYQQAPPNACPEEEVAPVVEAPSEAPEESETPTPVPVRPRKTDSAPATSSATLDVLVVLVALALLALSAAGLWWVLR